jgi:phosphotriesterase-related protein
MFSAPTSTYRWQHPGIETKNREAHCEADEIGLPCASAFRTDIRAGFIKTALESTFTKTHRKLFSAAARASLATGAAMMIHTDAGADPQMLLDNLTTRGVPPERLIFCHLDRTVGDINVHKALAASGAWIEYDTIGREKYHSDSEEIRIVLEMLHAGYGQQLLMSLDVTRARLRGYGGAPGLDYIIKSFLPRLSEAGIEEAQSREIFVNNPAVAFAVPAVPQ